MYYVYLCSSVVSHVRQTFSVTRILRCNQLNGGIMWGTLRDTIYRIEAVSGMYTLFSVFSLEFIISRLRWYVPVTDNTGRFVCIVSVLRVLRLRALL